MRLALRLRGHLLRRAKIAEPVFNPRLYADEEFIASPDAWWPEAEVAGEVDSRAYHLSPQDHERTLARDARMAAHGITVLHFTPRQIRTQPGTVVSAIRSALAAASSRPRLPIRTITTSAEALKRPAKRNEPRFQCVRTQLVFRSYAAAACQAARTAVICSGSG
jgi:hypothetical protein